MYIPNRFKAAQAETPPVSRLSSEPVRTAPEGDRGLSRIDRQGLEYTITPFMAANITKDIPRRNYVIIPGGEQVFREDLDVRVDGVRV